MRNTSIWISETSKIDLTWFHTLIAVPWPPIGFMKSRSFLFGLVLVSLLLRVEFVGGVSIEWKIELISLIFEVGIKNSTFYFLGILVLSC